MQTLQTILTLIQPNCYMATIDLKDAYYSVKIDGNDTFEVSCLAQWFVTRSSKVYKTNKASISNFKNARIYSCNNT